MKNGLLNIPRYSKADLVAGFQIALIALPLSIGISLASGFPAIAGVLSAIIGGLVVTWVRSGEIAINGPAAGLIVVVLHAVDTLGQGNQLLGYQYTLAAIVCAGLLQILIGKFKLGSLARYVPLAVVHGMLAGIGLIIIVKQLPIALGLPKNIYDLGFGEVFNVIHPGTALVGLVCIALAFGYAHFPKKAKQFLPSGLLVAVIGCALAVLLNHLVGAHTVSDEMKVQASEFVKLSASSLLSIGRPLFSDIPWPEFISATLSIAIVASLETLVSAFAIDKLDPEKRVTDVNKDITAIGVGTTVCGLLGGLPLIAEIVRSTANIHMGAKSRWANFFHGVVLLVAVVWGSSLIELIPLAALAALLVQVGSLLASPKHLLKEWKIGQDQFALFALTMVMVAATDILMGLAAGLALKIVFHAFRGVRLKNFFRCDMSLNADDPNLVKININKKLVFTNFHDVNRAITKFNSAKKIFIDLRQATLIDRTSLGLLDDLKFQAQNLGQEVNIFTVDSRDDVLLNSPQKGMNGIPVSFAEQVQEQKNV